MSFHQSEKAIEYICIYVVDRGMIMVIWPREFYLHFFRCDLSHTCDRIYTILRSIFFFSKFGLWRKSSMSLANFASHKGESLTVEWASHIIKRLFFLHRIFFLILHQVTKPRACDQGSVWRSSQLLLGFKDRKKNWSSAAQNSVNYRTGPIFCQFPLRVHSPINMVNFIYSSTAYFYKVGWMLSLTLFLSRFAVCDRYFALTSTSFFLRSRLRQMS